MVGPRRKPDRLPTVNLQGGLAVSFREGNHNYVYYIYIYTRYTYVGIIISHCKDSYIDQPASLGINRHILRWWAKGVLHHLISRVFFLFHATILSFGEPGSQGYSGISKTWQFFATFFWDGEWRRDPFKWLISDLQIGDEKVTVIESPVYIHKNHQKFDFNHAETYCFSLDMAKQKTLL